VTALGWTFADTWTITRRDLTHWRQRPGLVAIGWLFPVMVLLMFTGLFGGAMAVPDGDYLDFLLPGVFTVTMLFGLEGTMMAVATDAAKGVTDRFRSLPMTASAVVGGRCLADLLNSVVGLAVLIVTGLVLGWRTHHGVGAALGAVALLLWLRFGLLWVGVFLGLTAKGPQAVTAVQILVWPVGFLSSVFVDPATMPSWLGAIATWNPLSATASAVRDLFGGPDWAGGSPVAGLAALVWPIVLTVVFLPLSVRRYRRLGA
jgi:ABC-2 type transport system permease protein